MSWYYTENGKQAGPVTDEEWTGMVDSGKIVSTTMVWREGMSDWQPYSAVAPAGNLSSPGEVTVACSMCNVRFPVDEVISIEGRLICGNCKPMAVQSVKEGLGLPGVLNYAGFWIRFGAKILDTIILSVVNAGLTMISAVVVRPTNGEDSTALIIAAGLMLSQVLIQACYTVIFTVKMGATPGKLACGLRIIRPDGSQLTYGRAIGRYFAEIVSALTIGIGYIIAAFDEQKRTLHDRIADTRVVKK